MALMIKRAEADRCCGSLAANGLSIPATKRFELLINSQARLDGGRAVDRHIE
jgi:hypothetical protein